MLNRHGFSLHSAGVTGGSPEQLTITFFRGVSLKDLLDSVNPGRGYHLLRAVANKIQRKEVLIKPPLINRQSVINKFTYGLCDTNYIG